MKKIIGLVLILPALWIGIGILMLHLSFLINKTKDEWNNVELNEEDKFEKFEEKYMTTFMFGSGLLISFLFGWYLLWF